MCAFSRRLAGVTIDLTLPEYKIEDVVRDGVTYQQIAVDADGWAQAGQPGAPQLPERGVMVAVPPTGDVSLQILDVTSVAAPGSYRLQPAPLASLQEDQLVETWQADPVKYSEAAWTPAAQAEIAQEGWLRGYRFVRLALRPFQINPASGELRVASTLRVRLAFSEPGPSVPSLPADPIYAPVFLSTFANYDQAKAWQTRPQSGEVEARQMTTDSQVKVTVNADGLYRVTYNDLARRGCCCRNAGTPIRAPSVCWTRASSKSIYVFGEDDGVFNSTDYILFYGLRNKAALSDDNNVYWLTWGGANGLRMAQPNVAPGSASFANVVLTTLHAEENIAYKSQRPFVDWLQPVRYNSWYWNVEVNNDPVPIVTSKTITMIDVMVDPASTVAPVLSMWMAGNWDGANTYKTVFQLGNASPLDRTWTNTRVLTGTVTFPAGTLVNGANQITLTPVNVSGALHDEYGLWLDWLELTYPYNRVFRSNLVFNNPAAGTWRYSVTSAPSATPWVLDIGTPSQPKLLTGVSPTPTSGTYTLTWQQTTTAANRFLVVPDADVRQPAAVQMYVDAGLLNTNQQVDYLIISHSSLSASVQPLAAMHAASGLSVKIVDVRDIYDAFSDGSVSAKAIRDYLAYVYANYPWPAPAYVFLVGDGTVDFRGYKFAFVWTRKPDPAIHGRLRCLGRRGLI